MEYFPSGLTLTVFVSPLLRLVEDTVALGIGSNKFTSNTSPRMIEDFFLKASPLSGLAPKPLRQGGHIYRLGKTSRMLWSVGERLEPSFGKLGREYKQIAFDKTLLSNNPLIEWVTPGHPLFEAVRCYTLQKTEEDLQNGAVFFDLHSKEPYRLDVYTATVNDGRGSVVHRRIFVAQTNMDGSVVVRQPTIFHKLSPSGQKPELPDGSGLPGRDVLELVLFDATNARY
jgi:hypothetical protein